jgi:hypothetical protein
MCDSAFGQHVNKVKGKSVVCVDQLALLLSEIPQHIFRIVNPEALFHLESVSEYYVKT